MPKLIFTQSEIEDYFKEKTKHHFHETTVKMAHAMKVHADGEYPKELIEERRPNEPLEVKEYRKKIWVPTTKPTFSKVFSSLQKIRRSSDWDIRYLNLAEFTKISDQETIEQYTEKNFPYFTSMTNWAFSLLLRKDLIDTNAAIAVLPLEFNVAENEYLRPFPFLFDCVDVIDYVQDDFIVLNNPLGSDSMDREEDEGKSIFIITTKQFLRYDQINSRLDFKLVLDIAHELPILPAFTLKGVLIDQKDRHFLHESRIAGMLPELDEAVREYSDLQAAKVLHIYPERWEFSNSECIQCKGGGRVRNPMFTEGCAATVQAEIECDTCQGRGYVAAGPYSKIIIRPVNQAVESGSQIPNPPAGYVEKDVEIVKVMGESVQAHKYEALAAINFQFLEETPLNVSGKKAEVDKDELNNTVHSIAEDIVSFMDRIYKIIAYWRYKSIYSFDDIDRMLPVIPVPEKFDILSPQHKADELSKAKQDKANPVIINALEIDYASARFGIDPQVRDRLSLILELDPLPNITEDEKMSRLSNKGISLETYVISSNIHEFVQRAIDDDENFVDKKLKEQKEVMKKFAKEEIDKNTAAAQANMKLVQDTGGLGPDGQPIEDEENVAA